MSSEFICLDQNSSSPPEDYKLRKLSSVLIPHLVTAAMQQIVLNTQQLKKHCIVLSDSVCKECIKDRVQLTMLKYLRPQLERFRH